MHVKGKYCKKGKRVEREREREKGGQFCVSEKDALLIARAISHAVIPRKCVPNRAFVKCINGCFIHMMRWHILLFSFSPILKMENLVNDKEAHLIYQ